MLQFHEIFNILYFHKFFDLDEIKNDYDGETKDEVMEDNDLIPERDTVSQRAQLFTSWKADLSQDINGGFAFSWCLNGIFP